MKVLFVNPPVVRYNGKFNEHQINPRIALENFAYKYQKVTGKFLNFWVRKWTRGMRYGVRAGSRWPWTLDHRVGAINYPFIMAYATAFLKSQGFDAHLIDACAESEYSYKNFLTQVKDQKADIVVVECSTPTLDIDLWISQEISKFGKVALAGPHLTEKTVKEIQEKNPHIAYFLKGEYIVSALEMAKTQMPGIYEPKVVTSNINDLPFPYRDYKCAAHYYDPSMPTARPQLQILGSKGCPFECSFCMWPQVMYGGKVALRDPEKIAQEIRECIVKHNYKSIFFDDDTFNLGTERISKLCEHLKKIGLPWTMMGRLDCSPNWLYDKMVDSGCVGMRFGIETFNLEVLKNINKKLERIDFQKQLEHITNVHPQLMIHLTMMKNMPGQTEEIHKNDMQILKELGYFPDNPMRSYQLSNCVPFPGTKLYDDLMKSKDPAILNQYNLYDGGQETVMAKI